MSTPSPGSARNPRIVVVGSINMDLVVRSSRLPVPGETLFGRSFSQIPGGKGANQAVAAARLGADVSMVGRIGSDGFGQTLLAGLVSEGINVKHVLNSRDSISGLAVINVDDNGQNCITVIPGANGSITSDDVLDAEAVVADSDVLLLQFEIPLTAVSQAVSLARKHGVRIVLDPAPAQLDLPHELLSADVLCPNEIEAELLTGLTITSIDGALAACEQLRERGAMLSIVTLGGKGAVFCDHDHKASHVPPYVVDAVDTTAAGDAFAGALSVALAEGRSAIDAIRFASAGGALAATRHGAQPAMPRRDEIERLMEQPAHGR